MPSLWRDIPLANLDPSLAVLVVHLVQNLAREEGKATQPPVIQFRLTIISSLPMYFLPSANPLAPHSGERGSEDFPTLYFFPVEERAQSSLALDLPAGSKS